MKETPFYMDILLNETRNGVYVDGELFSQEEPEFLLMETLAFIVRQMGATVKGWIVPSNVYATFSSDTGYPQSLRDVPLSECSKVMI